jgi:calcineurin-like phosphoesterase family protein
MMDNKRIDIEPDYLLRTWITSDNHWFHKRVQEFCNRPDNWMNLMIDNWKGLVKENDYVLCLGDWALGNLTEIKQLIDILPGKIILLPGNHDRGRQLKLYKKEFFMVLDKEGFTYEKFIFTHRPLSKVPEEFINAAGHIHNNTIRENNRLNFSVENTNYLPVKLKNILEGDYSGLLNHPPFN